MTETEYMRRFHLVPPQDDLQRASCADAGKLGHWQCGVCPRHDRPRFVCGCIWDRGDKP